MSNDTIPLPRALTAENGAKAALSGEFVQTFRVECQLCNGTGEDGDRECGHCGGVGSWEDEVTISWTTIKAIWAKAVEHFEKQEK